MKRNDSSVGDVFRACGLALALSCGGLQAHEGQSERIERLDQEIAAKPEDPQLYFQRGEMHRICRHWILAEKDYKRASELDPEFAAIDLARATMWNDVSKSDKALPFLTDYHKKMPTDPEGYREQARALHLSGDPGGAAEAYSRTAELSETIGPELIAVWADCLSEAAREDEALEVVESGIRKIGPAVALEERALNLELKLGREDDALARIDGMLARSDRKDTLLLKKARILSEIGRTGAALDLVKMAEAAFEGQSERQRLSGYGRKLAAEIATLKTKLTNDPTP